MALTRVTSGGIAPGVQITFDQNNNPASPAVTFEGTAGTGMYSPANNQLAFATGGVERLKIDGSGNITVSGSAFLQVTNNERVVFVSQSDPNATDAVSNNGRSINKPFLTIERALIEVARLSYVPGTGDEQGEVGADDFEKYTVIVFPGDYTVDNRPGIANTTGITAGTLGDIFRYNSPNGGVIVPRGTSIVGLDLRKTVVRPRFVPDPEIGGESAIFRLTGGCYIWQLTIKDPSGVVRRGSTDTIWSTNPFSCHKMAGFKYATSSDLNFYYQKVNAFDANIPATANEFIQRVEENTIVGTKTINAIDTVASASPYVFNISLRSTFGMCGMHADGNDATGFQSMVVAQFTGISLQKDNNAFNAGKQYTDVTATYKTNWRHYHIKASNDAFIQVVSVFAVGYADHFIAESGGDVSITNSNSNFGNVAIRSSGFKANPYPLDQHGKITHVVAPKAFGKYIPGGTDNDVQKVRWSNIDIAETAAALGTSGSLQSNARIYLFGIPGQSNYDKSLIASAGGTYRVGLNPTEYLFIPRLSTDDTDDFIQLTLIGNSNPSVNPDGWNWFKYDSIKQKWYVEYNTSGITTFRNELFSGGSIRSQWQLLTSESIYVERRTGTRSADESLWKVRFVIPKQKHFQFPGVTDPGRPPEPGYVVRTTASNKRVYTIYNVETAKALSPTTDGIYYLTLFLGDAVSVKDNQLSTDSDANKHFQNKVYLYPTLNPDFPLDNPDRTQSTWDSENSVVVVVSPGTTLSSDKETKTNQIVEGRKRSLTRESIFTLLEELDTVATVSSYGGSKVDTDAGLNNAYNALMSANDSEGRPLAASSDVENRLIEIRNGTDSDDLISTYDDYIVRLHRPSNIRASGHTWEYVGYGPGNYSTAFPDFQKILLTENNLINAQSVSYNGGASYSTGMNSRGDFYIGNQRINPLTGQPQTLSSPSLLVEGRDNISAAIDSQITGLQNEINAEIAALKNNLTVESLQVNQILRSDNGIQIGSKTIGFSNGQLTPLSSVDDYGFAKKSSATGITGVSWKNDSDGFVTPQILEAWRVANGIISTVSKSADVFICDSIWKSWYENAEERNANFWSKPSYSPTQGSSNVSIKYTVLTAINGTAITASNEATALKSWTGSLANYKSKEITIYKTVTVSGVTQNFQLKLSPTPFPILEGNKLVGFNDSNYFLPFANFETAFQYIEENFGGSSSVVRLRVRPGVYRLPTQTLTCAVDIRGSATFSNDRTVDDGYIPLVYWRDEWAKHHKRAAGAYTSTNTSGYKGPISGVYFWHPVNVRRRQYDTIQGWTFFNAGFKFTDVRTPIIISNVVFLGTMKGLDYVLKYSIDDFALQSGSNIVPNTYRSPRAQRSLSYYWCPNETGFNPEFYSDAGNYIGAGYALAALFRLSTLAFEQGTSTFNFTFHTGDARINAVNSISVQLSHVVFGPHQPLGSETSRANEFDYLPRAEYIYSNNSTIRYQGCKFKGVEKFVVPKTLISSYIEFDNDGDGQGDNARNMNTITLSGTGPFGNWVNDTTNNTLYTMGHSVYFHVCENSTIIPVNSPISVYVRSLESVSSDINLGDPGRIYTYTSDYNGWRLDNGKDDLYVLSATNSDRDFLGQQIGLVFEDGDGLEYDGTSGKTIDNLINWLYNSPTTSETSIHWLHKMPVQVLDLSTNINDPLLFDAPYDEGGSASNPGDTITGSISGATARILTFTYFPTENSARLVAYNISGTFQSGETVTTVDGGTATIATAGTKLSHKIRNGTAQPPLYCGKSNLGAATIANNLFDSTANSNIDVSDLGPFVLTYYLISGLFRYRNPGGFERNLSISAYRLRHDNNGRKYRGRFSTVPGRTANFNTTGGIYQSFESDETGAIVFGQVEIYATLINDRVFDAYHDVEDFLTTVAQYTVNNGSTDLANSSASNVNSSGTTGTYYNDVRLNMKTHYLSAGYYPSIRLVNGDYVPTNTAEDGRLVYDYSDPNTNPVVMTNLSTSSKIRI